MSIPRFVDSLGLSVYSRFSLLTSAVCPARADLPPNVHRPRQGRSGLVRPSLLQGINARLACALACAGHVRGRPVHGICVIGDDADRPRRWTDLRTDVGDPRMAGCSGALVRHRGRHRGGLPIVARRGRCDDRRNRHILPAPRLWLVLPATRWRAAGCDAVRCSSWASGWILHLHLHCSLPLPVSDPAAPESPSPFRMSRR